MLKILSVICLLPLLSSCNSTHYTPKNYKATQLIIGSTGGVTGMIKEITLLGNGQCFMSKGVTGELKELKEIRSSDTHKIFKKAEELELSSIKFNHPGNMTYYLILKTPPKSNVVKWGESGISIPPDIKEFYDYLLSVFKP